MMRFNRKENGAWARIGRCVLALFALGVAPVLWHPVFGQDAPPPSSTDRILTRGRGFVTLTFSLDQRSAENEEGLIQQILDQDRLNYTISWVGGYALKENLTLGFGLRYGRRREDRTFVQDGEERTSRLVSNSYSFGPSMRNYIPLGAGVLQIFVQTDLNVILEESLERVFRTEDIDKLEGNIVGLGLGVRPGAVLFFDRHWAFEVSVGLAGLSSQVETLTRNGDDDNRTRIVRNNIDLQINLLALNLGVAYYF